MMRKGLILAIMLMLGLAACAPFPKDEIRRAKDEIEAVYYTGIPEHLPDEWSVMRDVWSKLDKAELDENRDEAMRWFYFVQFKIPQLEAMLDKVKLEQEERRKKEADEAKRRAEELKATEAADESTEEDAGEDVGEQKNESVKKAVRKEKTMDMIRTKLERRAPSYYTVKDGDSLESIAGLTSIYNDQYQWPILYKYNRNQIANPKRLFKGQMLRIPRGVTNDEVVKAREEAGSPSPSSIPASALTSTKYKKIIDQLKMED